MRFFWAGVRFQALMMRRSLDNLTVLVTLPMFTLAFLAILLHSGRRDLAPYAVIGSAVMAVWSISLFVSGDVIDVDRQLGTLDGLISSPSAFPLVVFGRIATVTAVSFVGLPEAIAVTRLAFGITVVIRHPWVFAGTLLCTGLAMAGTASVMSGLFVLTRGARSYQNSLSYPFYVLGGAIVPISVLPVWLHPLARLVFLSWSSDLLRASLSQGPVPDVAARLGVILLLGGLALATGYWMIGRIIDRSRRVGTLSHA